MINVINLIDGVDGLAAGVCVISAATLSIIALSLDRPGAGVLAALTAGGALGFLRHGFPPASSFMGDTGSNLLGYLLGAIAVQGALKTNAVVALFFPLIVLAVPILDTGFVIAKRIKYRQPIYRADRWHFHHRMANIGFSQRRTLAYLYGWALVMAGLALALRFVPYSDDHGHFDPLWTVVIIACWLAALAASVYLWSRSRSSSCAGIPLPRARRARARRAAGRGGRRRGRARARDRQLRRGRPGDGRVRGDRPRYRRVRSPLSEVTSLLQRASRQGFGRRAAPFRIYSAAPPCAGRCREGGYLVPSDRARLPGRDFDFPGDRDPSGRADAAMADGLLAWRDDAGAAAGYGLGSLVGLAVPLGLVGLFAGLVVGLALVHARSRRI